MMSYEIGGSDKVYIKMHKRGAGFLLVCMSVSFGYTFFSGESGKGQMVGGI